MELVHAVGGTIKKLRTQHNMTLREVSGKKYIAIGHLSDIERGVKQPSYQMLDLLADVFNLSTAELLKEIYTYLEEHERTR